jgi:uncharacterized protein (TIGR02246 family)
MRLLMIAFMMAVAGFSLSDYIQVNADQASDETAIRELVRQYVEARERHDARAVESLFTADADQLVSSGEWRKGREAVVKGAMASSRNNAGRRTITVETVRFISADVAIADGRYELVSQMEGARNMWATMVMKRVGKNWRIAAIRNMLPAPPASR